MTTASAEELPLPDVLASDLDLLMVGINPSIYSAEQGCHYARPGNRFWPALFAAGVTPRLLAPRDQRQLLRWGCGLTNIVARPTSRANELSRAEIQTGWRRLAEKVGRYRVRHVAVLGLTAYRQATGDTNAACGGKGEPLGQADVHVLPNPSGLNAHYQLADLAELFRDLAEMVWPPHGEPWRTPRDS